MRAESPEFVERVTSALEEVVPPTRAWLEAMAGHFDLSLHAEEVDEVLTVGLDAPALAEALRAGPRTVLYSGRARVPRALLETGDLRFLHVHPGKLPEVRGADGLLWSLLVRGRPGMSGFYMTPEIDAGDVVTSADLPGLSIPLPPGLRPDDDVLYRAVFSFVDPVLRADSLIRDVLPAGDDPAALPTRPQEPWTGTTFHFLHPRLRRRALERLFPAAT